MPSRVATHVASPIPAIFPATRPTTIPTDTRLLNASASESEDSRTPAFASANNGRIRKLVHGSRACSTRASGETASFESDAR